MMSEGGPAPTANAEDWLTVAEHASFTTRITISGREMRYVGPGRVRPCGGDVAIVAAGTAIGLPGGGEAPGAEQWVATPCAVVRWASGAHRVSVSANECRVQSSVGDAFVYSAPDVHFADDAYDAGAGSHDEASPPSVPTKLATSEEIDAGGAANDGWRPLGARRALKARGALWPVGPAVTTCEAAAAVAKKTSPLASSPLRRADDAGIDPTFGEHAAASVVARRRARAACTLAEARVEAAGPDEAARARVDAAIRSVFSSLPP
jgi:hypothetical protein